MGQFHYSSIEEMKRDNGVKSHKNTADGLVAIHKRNSVGSYYWKYYRYTVLAGVPGYYYTGSTSTYQG